MIQFRTTQLVQEFSFWPSSPPKQLGGIYEMRNYSLVRCLRTLYAAGELADPVCLAYIETRQLTGMGE